MYGSKKTTLIILLLISLFFLIACQGSDDTTPDEEEGLQKALAFYQEENPQLDSWWEMVALYGAGVDLGSEPWKLPSWASEDLPPGSAPTMYAGYILGLLARGEDPWAWQGRHLPAELASLQEMDGSFGGSVNNTIWAMLTLDVAGFAYAREAALTYLLGEQKEDGGFALTGSDGDPDVTAMALLAFSLQRDNPGVEAAVQRSLEYLKGAMLPSGGFASYNEENANSTAIVLSALISLAEDLNGETWLAEDGGTLEALLAYQMENGSFSFFLDPLKGDNMATYQAMMALGDAVAGTSVFKRLQEAGEKYRRDTTALLPADPPRAEPGSGAVAKGTAVTLVTDYRQGLILYTLDGSDPREEGREYTEPLLLEEAATLKAVVFVIGMGGSPVASFEYTIKEEKTTAQKPSTGSDSETKPKTPTFSVTLRVVGESKTYYNGKVNVPEDKANALQALLSTGLRVKVLSGGFVQAVGGEENAGVSGWKFKVNNQIPGVSALAYTIKAGDTVVWWYADTPNSTGP